MANALCLKKCSPWLFILLFNLPTWPTSNWSSEAEVWSVEKTQIIHRDEWFVVGLTIKVCWRRQVKFSGEGLKKSDETWARKTRVLQKCCGLPRKSRCENICGITQKYIYYKNIPLVFDILSEKFWQKNISNLSEETYIFSFTVSSFFLLIVNRNM